MFQHESWLSHRGTGRGEAKSNVRTYDKITRALGTPKGQQLIEQALSELSLSDTNIAVDPMDFGNAGATRNGLFDAFSLAIEVQALVQGATHAH